MRTVLAVGGSDSGGGAGIQADVRTLHALGVHATTVVTAVTAQSTVAVDAVWEVPPDAVRAQLRSVLDDIGANVVKTGMLTGPEQVALVTEAVAGLPLVVDPVGAASTGRRLGDPQALRALLPHALVVTPNLAEVAALTGLQVRSRRDLHAAAEAVLALGPRWVLVTGGHLDGDPIDLLHDGTTTHTLSGPRVRTPHTHGTGCTLAAALAGFLALGEQVPVAAARAKDVVTEALRRSYPLGRGAGPVRPGAAPPT